jgi:signal transduction histidine kinase
VPRPSPSGAGSPPSCTTCWPTACLAPRSNCRGARLLAAREPTSERVQEAIQRAGDLVNDGLANARAAVGALRGEPLPGIADLQDLVASFRRDFLVPASLAVRGRPRPLSADTDLLLYRAAQEALTNVARYAAGAPTIVSLDYQSGRTCLTVQNRATGPDPADGSLPAPRGLPTVGGRHGLTGGWTRSSRPGCTNPTSW